jgi:hypothetical protein
MLAATYTASVSVPTTHNVVFGTLQQTGNQATYVAPSDQSDITGRPVLRFSNEESNKGIVRSLMQIRLPHYNSATSKYDGEYTANLTVTRPAGLPIVGAQQVLEIIAELIVANSFEIRDIIAAGRL